LISRFTAGRTLLDLAPDYVENEESSKAQSAYRHEGNMDAVIAVLCLQTPHASLMRRPRPLCYGSLVSHCSKKVSKAGSRSSPCIFVAIARTDTTPMGFVGVTSARAGREGELLAARLELSRASPDGDLSGATSLHDWS